MTVVIGLLGVVLGGLVGAVTAYVTTRSNMLLQLEHAYDMTLRDRRLERYQKLFHISQCLPRYWVDGSIPSRSDLVEYRVAFSDWYFGDEAGGMYLTPASKALYLTMQAALLNGARPGPGEAADSPIAHDVSESIRRCASELRHQLAEDVGVAQPPRLRWARVRSTEPPTATGLTTLT